VVHQLWKQTFESGIATALLLSSMHEEILQIWLQAAQRVPQLLCSDDMVLEYTVTSALHIASQFSANNPQYNVRLTASELMVTLVHAVTCNHNQSATGNSFIVIPMTLQECLVHKLVPVLLEIIVSGRSMNPDDMTAWVAAPA
jgi:hypothetical protein